MRYSSQQPPFSTVYLYAKAPPGAPSFPFSPTYSLPLSHLPSPTGSRPTKTFAGCYRIALVVSDHGGTPPHPPPPFPPNGLTALPSTFSKLSAMEKDFWSFIARQTLARSQQLLLGRIPQAALTRLAPPLHVLLLLLLALAIMLQQ